MKKPTILLSALSVLVSLLIDIASADGADEIHGHQGDDEIFGRGGRDYLYGDRGDDEIEGGDELLGTYNNGDSFTIFDWRSDPGSPNFHDDNSTNESLSIPIPPPTSPANSIQFNFNMLDAGNDWWWAIDDVVVTADVPEPAVFTMLLAGIMTIPLLRHRLRPGRFKQR